MSWSISTWVSRRIFHSLHVARVAHLGVIEYLLSDGKWSTSSQVCCSLRLVSLSAILTNGYSRQVFKSKIVVKHAFIFVRFVDIFEVFGKDSFLSVEASVLQKTGRVQHLVFIESHSLAASFWEGRSLRARSVNRVFLCWALACSTCGSFLRLNLCVA